MNPLDYLLLILSLIPIGMLLLSGRGTINEYGPLALGVCGAAWHFWFQWLRDRSYLRHRDTGFVPGTQHLAGWAIFGACFFMLAATVWFFSTHPLPLRPLPALDTDR